MKLRTINCATCGTPYILRVAVFVMNKAAPEWMYQADCKCRPRTHTMDTEPVLISDGAVIG